MNYFDRGINTSSETAYLPKLNAKFDKICLVSIFNMLHRYK